MGELNMSLYSSTTLSAFFCYVAESRVEAMDVATTFFSPYERIIKRTNFPVCVITFMHCLAKIREMEAFAATYGIL